MALHGHQDIYGGDEGLRHHLCVSHNEHRDEGATRQELEGLHEDEHPSTMGHRGEWGCEEHDPSEEPTEFHDMHERNGGIGGIHRGIGVSLPDRVHKVVHDLSRPVHERAQALMDHVSSHPDHLGMHWTTENNVAEDFAERSAQHEASQDQRGRYALDDFSWGHEERYKDTPLGKPGTAVVFHSHEPSLDAIENDGHRLSNGGTYGWSQHGEREVPVRDTHSLDLKGVSWAPMHSDDEVPGHGEYTHHDFGGGHEHTAAVVAHFEAAGAVMTAPRTVAEPVRVQQHQPVERDHGGDDPPREFGLGEGGGGDGEGQHRYLVTRHEARHFSLVNDIHDWGSPKRHVSYHQSADEALHMLGHMQRAGAATPHEVQYVPKTDSDSRRDWGKKYQGHLNRWFNQGSASYKPHPDVVSASNDMSPDELQAHWKDHHSQTPMPRLKSTGQHDDWHNEFGSPAIEESVHADRRNNGWVDHGSAEQHFCPAERLYGKDAAGCQYAGGGHVHAPSMRDIFGEDEHRDSYMEGGHGPGHLSSKQAASELLGHFEAAGYSISHTAPGPDAGHLPWHHYTGDSPDDHVQVYRAAPLGTESVNPGDWISLSSGYAHRHARQKRGPDWPVYTASVPQKHVHWDENDENEHGYSGPSLWHPDVHDEETGSHTGWDAHHEGRLYESPAEPARPKATPEEKARRDESNRRQHEHAWRATNDPLYRHYTKRADGDDYDRHWFPQGMGDGTDEQFAAEKHYTEHAPEEMLRRIHGTVHEAAAVDDYGMQHRPVEESAPVHDLGSGMAEDVYTHPHYWDGSWPNKSSMQGYSQLRKARGNPDAPVTVYRASPPGTPYKMHTGDWVSLSSDYAQQHIDSNGDGDWHVHKAVVPARHVRDAGTDPYREQGYWGPDVDSQHHSGPRPQQKEAAVSPRQAGRQQEGDERAFGDYRMRYQTRDNGERRPRHVIHAFTPEGAQVGELNWYGTTGTVHHVGVAGPEDSGNGEHGSWGDGQDHRRRGLATAMWDWGQEMTPKPRHSKDQTTQGKDWVKGLKNPRKDPPSLPDVVAHFEAEAADEPGVTVEHHVQPSGGSQYPHMHTLTATHPDGTTAQLRYMMSKRNGKGVVDHAYIPRDRADDLGKPLVQKARELHPGSLIKGLPGIDEDWDQHLPSVTSVHRNLTMKLAPEDHSIVHDGSVPRAERARHLMGLMESGGASMHWASQRGRAAADKFGDHEFRSPGDTQVSVSAAPPAREHVETDPERISRNGGYAYQAPDWEVPLKQGGQVNVTSVRWRAGNGSWTQHHFRDGHQFTAGLRPASAHEVVAHFEEPGQITVTAAEYGPKPPFQAAPEGASEDEQTAHWNQQRDVKRAWESHVLHGISTGQLHPDRAKELGHYFDGHQTDERGHSRWQPMPQHLYHVTTDVRGVMNGGGLKTRSELAQQRGGHGLGGGPDDMISMTDSHETARGILNSVHEFHHVVNGRYTPAQMWEDARSGKGADRPFHQDVAQQYQSGWKDGDPVPARLHDIIHGREHMGSMFFGTHEEMKAKHGPEWEPADDGYDAPKGRVHGQWSRPAGEDHRREQAAGLYKTFAVNRAWAGGPEDPLFFSTDTKAFAQKDPKNFGIVHARPRPGAMGHPVSALGEWRTATGDALETTHAESPGGYRPGEHHPREAAMRFFAALENPHDHGHDWYHGSPYRFGDFGGDGPDSRLAYEGDEDDQSHWNTLVGHHFAASHVMAEEFSKGEHGGEEGHGEEGPAQNVVHARLEMKNPRHYASEHDMDQEAYEHEFRAGNHHDGHHEPGELAEAKEGGWEDELPRTYHYAGHGDRLRSQEEPDEQYRQMGHYHPYATGWLNAHPDKYGIAQRHRQRLEAAGHDGITYGNEFEHNTGDGKAGNAHVCAVPFHGSQIDVTQRHSGAHCLPQHDAERQWPGRSQPMLPGMGEHEGSLDVVAHFEQSRTAAPVHMQQKLFHAQPDPTEHAPDSGRHNPADPDAHVDYREEHEDDYRRPAWTRPSPAGWSYNHETYGIVQARGPEGRTGTHYTDGSGLEDSRHHEDVHGPLYHGTNSQLDAGDSVEPGHPGNFSDEPLEHVYMTERAERTADHKGARGYGRHVYEVQPTGWYGHRSDARGIDWASQAHLRVVREVPRPSEHTAAVVVHFEQEAAAHPMQNEDGSWLYGHQPAHLSQDLPEEMHRGVGFRLSPDVHAVVHDESRPLHERAHALLSHLDEHSAQEGKYGDGGVGIHWSVNERTARGFAVRRDPQADGRDWDSRDPHSTQVVFHAQTAAPSQMLRGKKSLSEHEIFGLNHGEGEIPLKKRSRVNLTGISWAPNGDRDAGLTRHDFPKPVVRGAGYHTVPEAPKPKPAPRLSADEEMAGFDWRDHEASRRLVLGTACDTVTDAGMFAPVVEAANALGSWEPASAGEAYAAVRDMGDVFAALRQGVLRAAVLTEEMPLDPDVPDGLHDLARCLRQAEQDHAEVTRALPPEDSWEEPPARPNR